jgi:hypothetical protein
MPQQGWIGVDLDGTLAQYEGWQGHLHIGSPVEAMVERVRSWVERGHPLYGPVVVKIVTARVSRQAGEDAEAARRQIQRWCREYIGHVLEVTNEKDFGMIELWDDRAVQVEPNTGRRLDGQPEPVGPA